MVQSAIARFRSSLDDQIILHPRRTCVVVTLATAITIIGIVGAILMGVTGRGTGLFIPTVSLLAIEVAMWGWMVYTWRRQKAIEGEYVRVVWTDPTARAILAAKLGDLTGDDTELCEKLLECFGRGLRKVEINEDQFELHYQSAMEGIITSGGLSGGINLEKRVTGKLDLTEKIVEFTSGVTGSKWGLHVSIHCCRIGMKSVFVRAGSLPEGTIAKETVLQATVTWE